MSALWGYGIVWVWRLCIFYVVTCCDEGTGGAVFCTFPLFGNEFSVNLVEPCHNRNQSTMLATNDLELSACSPVFKFLICIYIYVRLLKRGGRLPSVMHCCVSFPTNQILHLAFTGSVSYESLRNVYSVGVDVGTLSGVVRSHVPAFGAAREPGVEIRWSVSRMISVGGLFFLSPGLRARRVIQ